MKSPAIILIVVAVLGIGACTFSQPASEVNSEVESDSMMKKDEAVMQKETQESMVKEDVTMKKEEAMMEDRTSTPRYAEYSKDVLDKTATNRRVLFFYASWCPICHPADTSFKENINKIPEDVSVIRVNYNDPGTDQDEKDLAKKYGITYQHTFVQIDGDGNEIAKWNGGQINELLSNIK